MKKQFFYAAMAIALMSSCSNNDLPGAQDPENPQLPEEEKVAIAMSIDMPSVVNTRGTGSVGDLATNTGTNIWNGQDLGIFMVKKGTMQKATDTENGAYIFAEETFRAPFASENKNSGAIKFKTGNVKYYPMQGSFDFYGYHFDGTDVNIDDFPEEGKEQKRTLTGKIDGTNDVMAATTKLSSADSVNLINKVLGADTYSVVENGTISASGTAITDASKSEDKAKLDAEIAKVYSSYAARRDVQPTLKFQHLLARLKFNVRAGEDKAATEHYTESTNQVARHYFPALTDVADGEHDAASSAVQGESEMTDQAVYIRSVKVTGQQYDLTITYKPGEAPALSALDPAENDLSTFTLKERKANENTAAANELVDLVPVAPKNKPSGTSDPSAATPVGESMMIVPGESSFDVEIQAMQYVMTNDGQGETGGAPAEAQYKWKLYTLKTKINAPTDAGKNPTGLFDAGKSYNINVTVYGFQKIEVTATLEGWIDGGDVESNPEDDMFNSTNP